LSDRARLRTRETRLAAHAWGARALDSLGGRYQYWREGGELDGSIDVWGAALLVAHVTGMFAASAFLVVKAEADASS
jgi:hypothetical protein